MRVYEFYEANRALGKKYTKDHFAAEKIPERTIYSIIQRAENESGHERTVGSGRPATIMTKKNVKRLKTMFDHKDGVSQTQAARKFRCSQPYICKTLASKTTIRARKKMKIPKRTDQQRAVARTKCSRLCQIFQNDVCIMDDESYFTLAHTSINGNDRFYTSDVDRTPAAVKYAPTAKYEKKMLVYLCFSEKGISKPYFVPSGVAVNQKVYLEECIKKKLIPFIEEHHSEGKYVFWPDLASAHYAKSVVTYLREKKVHFVEKYDNPANLPECRPIENFWSILKGEVYKNNWQAENLDQLRNRIKYCLGKVDFNLIQSLARSIPGHVDKVRRNGVIEAR